MAVEIAKLREMSPKELDQEEQELREEIWKLRLQRSSGQLQDYRKVKRTRHELARVLTVKKEKHSTAAGKR